MKNTCPMCRGDLGELNELQAALRPMMFGKIEFLSDCCNLPFLGTNKNGHYFVAPKDKPDAAQMIGAG